eukprot:1098286-Pleurochrysis_carterae.AAC.2
MAACAQVNWAEERARMAEEWPGATDSAARPSELVAEGRKEANLLASASNFALSARRRMAAAGDSKRGGSRGRDINVEEGFNVSKDISVKLIGAEDSAQGGVAAVEKAR